jgi:hypothetical protein
LEECSVEWGRMANKSEEGQGPQRAVVPVMMKMIDQGQPVDGDREGL